jgi:hypothetical protein
MLKSNDPRPAPLSVMLVMTPAADAVEIEPPNAKAAITILEKLFISVSL